jgi:hypothetical protein
MVLSLWLAAYLLARGFSSGVTLRAVVVLVLLAGYFYSAYLSAVDPTFGSAVVRAVLAVWGLIVWYDLTDKLVPPASPSRQRYLVLIFYGLAAIATVVLFTQRQSLVPPSIDLRHATRGPFGPAIIAVGVFHTALLLATLYNFYLITRAGAGAHYRFFFIVTGLVAVDAVGYYVLFVPGLPAIPAVVQNILLLLLLLAFGYAVARHQAFIERRTTLHDFPISGIAVVGLAGLYALLADQHNFSRPEVADIAVLAILTHSSIDLVREFLERVLHRGEGELRLQLRQLARTLGDNNNLSNTLRDGLAILCQRLNAQGAFVALKRDGHYVVAASINSRPNGALVEVADSDDLAPPGPNLAHEIDWLAPAFAGTEQLGVIGLRPARSARSRYSEAELDLLAEAADWVGLLATTSREQRAAQAHLANLAAEAQSREVDLQTGTEDLLATIEQDPAPEFVELVEDALRNLADYTVLGHSPLAQRLKAPGVTHVERGKAVRERLIQALETLRPSGQRPAEPMPPEWQGYIVLHDAYLDDVPNREIMARLYISQGTFNRRRRRALRAVARNLLEINQAVVVPTLGQPATA